MIRIQSLGVLRPLRGDVLEYACTLADPRSQGEASEETSGDKMVADDRHTDGPRPSRVVPRVNQVGGAARRGSMRSSRELEPQLTS